LRITAGYALFDPQRNEEILEEFKVEAVDEKLGRQLKLAATCNKNEQQLVARLNDELQTKWKKKTAKAFEETIRRGRNRSNEAELVTNYYYYYYYYCRHLLSQAFSSWYFS